MAKYYSIILSPNALKLNFLFFYGQNQGIAIAEAVLLVFIFWQLILKGKILSFFRITPVLMILLSWYCLDSLLYELLCIQNTEKFQEYCSFMNSITPLSLYIFFIGKMDVMINAIPILSLYILAYIFMKIPTSGFRMYMPRSYTKTVMEIYDLKKMINSFSSIPRAVFYPRVRFKTQYNYNNAYCLGNKIVLGTPFCEYPAAVVHGIIAHELGHFYHRDGATMMINLVCLQAIMLPLNIIQRVFNLINALLYIVPFLRIFIFIPLMYQVSTFIVQVILKCFYKILYWLGGRRSERRADLFAVDNGFGIGLYAFLKKSMSGTYDLFDEHPSNTHRLEYIEKRVRENWGKEYLEKFLEEVDLYE